MIETKEWHSNHLVSLWGIHSVAKEQLLLLLVQLAIHSASEVASCSIVSVNTFSAVHSMLIAIWVSGIDYNWGKPERAPPSQYNGSAVYIIYKYVSYVLHT